VTHKDRSGNEGVFSGMVGMYHGGAKAEDIDLEDLDFIRWPIRPERLQHHYPGLLR
jgi:hypothetical protein